jgi:hypothetical protein
VETHNTGDPLGGSVCRPKTEVNDAVDAAMTLFFGGKCVTPDVRNEVICQLKVFARNPRPRQVRRIMLQTTCHTTNLLTLHLEHPPQMIYRTGRLAALVPQLLDRTVTEGVAALMINMTYHVPGQVVDDIGVPQSMYVEYLVHHGVCPNMVAAVGKAGHGAHRTTQLLLMGLCNLTSHGNEYKDEICRAPGIAAMMATCLLTNEQQIANSAAKLLNALCCQDTAISFDRVTAMAEGGVPAAVAAVFLDKRPATFTMAASLVPLLFSMFQQSHVRFCRNFLINGGDAGIRRMTESLKTRFGRPKEGQESVVKQLIGIRWWQESFSRPMTPLLRALITLNRRRGAPSSYMGLKRQLVAEFGEEVFKEARKEIQCLLTKRHKQHEMEVAGMVTYTPVLCRNSPTNSVSPLTGTPHQEHTAPPGSGISTSLVAEIARDPRCVKKWEQTQLAALDSIIITTLEDVFQQATFTAICMTDSTCSTGADSERSRDGSEDESGSDSEGDDDYAAPTDSAYISPFTSPKQN